MGSWNETCAVSNLHITPGTEVVVFILTKNLKNKHNFCYTNALYQPCLLPFYATYDDYGQVANAHGFALNDIVNAIKDNLYELDLGENTSHDIEVKKDDFDLEMLFEANHEQRLGVVGQLDYSDLYSLIHHFEEQVQKGVGITEREQMLWDQAEHVKKTPGKIFQPITRVMVHAQVFDDILNHFYLERQTGYGLKPTFEKFTFSDVIELIPLFIEKHKALFKDKQSFWGFDYVMQDNIDNLAWRLLCSFSGQGSPMPYPVINMRTFFAKMLKEEWDTDLMAQYLVEAAKGLWLDNFMDSRRTLWVPPCGGGSQNTEVLAYQVLNQSVDNILKNEQ